MKRPVDSLRLASFVLLLVLASCSSAPSATTAPESGDAPRTASPDAAPRDGGAAERPPAGDGGGEAGNDGGLTPTGATYRDSLSVCWRDPTCVRTMAVGHGGDWSLSGNPYDSNAALAAAYAGGADGVKIDVRVTSDGVPVIAHSSPIEAFESLDCYNKKIEEMTAAAVTSCHRLPSKTETFQRLDTVLAYLKGKLTVELTVKRQVDYAVAIAAVLAAGAESFAYFEVSTSDLQTLLPPISGADKVYYLMNIKALSEVDVLLDTIKNPRAFMYEFDPDVALATVLTTRLRPAGIRTFTYIKSSTVSQAQLAALYDKGFDVVSSNLVPQTVQARIQVNTARGVSPP